MTHSSMKNPTPGESEDDFDIEDDLDIGDDPDEEAVVDGLYEVLTALMTLRNERVSRGISLAEIIERCRCDPRAIQWADDGDVGAPLEGLAYYAAALDMRVSLRLEPR